LIPLVAGLTFALPSDGRAQSPPAEQEQDAEAVAKAREAFKLGTALAKQGQWSEALAAYERAQSLHHHASTSYNIGFCLRALGRYTAARAMFEQALAEGRARPDELPAQLEKDATSFLREIEGKIVRLTVTVLGEDAALSVDGRPLLHQEDGPYVAGVRDLGNPEGVGSPLVLQLDPGEHTLVLEQGGSPLVLQLDPGEHTLVLEQGGESEVVTVDYEAGAVDSLTLGNEPEVPGATGPDHRPAAYVSWGLAGAATITGIVAGSIALSTRSSLDDICDPDKTCPEDEAAAIHRMQRAADISTASFVVAGAGAILGTVLFFTSPHDDVEVGVGPGGAQVRLSF
jgi:hypothetical protein